MVDVVSTQQRRYGTSLRHGNGFHYLNMQSSSDNYSDTYTESRNCQLNNSENDTDTTCNKYQASLHPN